MAGKVIGAGFYSTACAVSKVVTCVSVARLFHLILVCEYSLPTFIVLEVKYINVMLLSLIMSCLLCTLS